MGGAVSKSVAEIVNSIREYPDRWRPWYGINSDEYGLKLNVGGVEITKCGNVMFIFSHCTSTSVCRLCIEGGYFPLSASDMVAIERAVKWWWANTPLSLLVGAK